MPDNNQNRSQRIVKNTLFLYVRMFVVLAIGLYTSRIILKALGETDFGIYNLVGGVITMFVFINQSLNSATQRFITFDLGLEDNKRLRSTFSMTINVYALFSILLVIILETAGSYLLSRLNIDSSRMSAARWVFQAMILTTVINMLGIPYGALINAHEKMSFTALVGILDSVLKLGIAFLVSFLCYDKLKLYSLLLVIISILNFLLKYLYCTNNFSFVSRYKFDWDKKKFLHFIKFSGLSLYEQVAVMLTYQGVDILLNLFFGVIVNAAMGITKQVQAAVFNFVANFQGAMTPQITKSYAAKDSVYLSRLMVAAPKFSLYLVLLLALPVFFNLQELLNFWLVEVPPYTVGFCKLILISSVVESISLPLRTLIFASGKIRKYQLIVGSTFLLNLVLSYWLLKKGNNPSIVLWVRISIFILIDVIRVIFVRKLINLSFFNYIKATFFPFLIISIISLISSHYYYQNSSFPLTINLLVTFLFVFLLVAIIGLTRFERGFFLRFLKIKNNDY